MTINYCDFLNGDDSTGDGSNINPYKTITHSSTGLTGDDEVRVAKSPNSTILSGTLAFVNGSTNIDTSIDLSSELIPGDFVSKTGEYYWWEVIAITSTTLTLYKKYPGTTETIISKKLGTIDTEILYSGNSFEEIMSSGLSTSSRLTISGGWDLSTLIQSGYTFFRQMNSVFEDRMGKGLFINRKDNLSIENLCFLRFTNGIDISICENINFANIINCSNKYYGIVSVDEFSTNFNFDSCYFNANNLYGMFFYYLYHSTFTSCECKSNEEHGIEINSVIDVSFDDFDSSYNMYGINLRYGSNCSMNNIICNYNQNNGMTIDHDYNFSLYDITCNNNQYGIYLSLNNDIIMNTVDCNNNSSAFYLDRESSVIINNYSGTGNIIEVSTLQDQQFTDMPVLKMQHFKTLGDNRCYYEFGITSRDTIEARSTQCLRYEPTSDVYYIKQQFHFVAPNGIEKNISFYIKDNVTFDGDVQAALFFMGKKITGWASISTTESYVLKNLIALSSDITEDGVIELHIKVRGTTGNVYVDDIGVL